MLSIAIQAFTAASYIKLKGQNYVDNEVSHTIQTQELNRIRWKGMPKFILRF